MKSLTLFAARLEEKRFNDVASEALAAGVKHVAAHGCSRSFVGLDEHPAFSRTMGGCPALRRIDLAWSEALRARELMQLEVLFAALRVLASPPRILGDSFGELLGGRDDAAL